MLVEFFKTKLAFLLVAVPMLGVFALGLWVYSPSRPYAGVLGAQVQAETQAAMPPAPRLTAAIAPNVAPPQQLPVELLPERQAAKAQAAKITPDSLSVLVDKSHALPKDYAPKDLVLVSAFGLRTSSGKVLLRREAAQALAKMTTAMRAAKLTVLINSGYRSYAQQVATFKQALKAYGEDAAELRAAAPGHSEHQLGTTVDLVAPSKKGKFASLYPGKPTAYWRWLDQNAHKYGFVMSYRSGQTAATGYRFEPWHWRYVGIELATKIRGSHSNPQQFYQALK